MKWHDPNCKRPDIINFGDGRSCLACGSMEPRSILPPIRQQSEIRILRLQHGAFDDPIVCEVNTKNLACQPEYEAVSYTWADESGDATRSRTIHIDGRPYQVTVNCENALRRLRRQFSYRKLWIDAICIDQDNMDERGHQVQLMPRIYSGAKAVQIYVGELTPQSQIFLQSQLNHTHDYQKCNLEYGYKFKSGMIEFVSRRYFSRAWVLQEVALARKATVICGSVSIPWSLLRSGEIGNLVRAGQYAVSARKSIPPCFSFDRSVYSTPGQELKLLDFARKCVATDPRDKIFSLLGMIPGGRLGTIEADYSLTVSQLYAKTAHYLASQYGWMGVLCRAGVDNALLAELPSWAPDWTSPLRKDPMLPSDLPELRFEDGEWNETTNTLTLKLLQLPAGKKWRASGLILREPHLVGGLQNLMFPPTRDVMVWRTPVVLASEFYASHHATTASIDLSVISAEGEDGDANRRLPQVPVHAAQLYCRQAGQDTHTLVNTEKGSQWPGILWSYIPARIAVQIFTMTITEMHHYEMYCLFMGDEPRDLLPYNVETVEDTMVDLLHRIEDLHHQEATNEELEDLWMKEYLAGNLVRVKALEQSSVRLQKSPPEPDPGGNGPNSVRHPEFVRINDGFWRLLVRHYVLQETTLKLV